MTLACLLKVNMNEFEMGIFIELADLKSRMEAEIPTNLISIANFKSGIPGGGKLM